MSKNFRFIYKNESELSKDSDLFLGEVKNNRLIKYTNLSNRLIGNIYRGRVKDYLKSMDAFIVNIGEDKDAILKSSNRFNDIKVGEQIIVELVKQSYDQKMYEISEYLSLYHKDIKLVPYANPNSKSIVKKYKHPFIIISKDIDDDMIKEQYIILEDKFEKVLLEKNYLPTPKLLILSNYLDRFIEDYDGDIISNIKIEGTQYDTNFNPKYDSLINKDLILLESKKIKIDNISIVVEKLEALTVIDVNSGYNKEYSNKEQMSYEVNIKAIEEIAIQLKLREIKKMIIIDFIRLNNENKQKIIDELKSKFIEYNIKHKIMGYSNLELLEIIIY